MLTDTHSVYEQIILYIGTILYGPCVCAGTFDEPSIMDFGVGGSDRVLNSR